MAESTGKWYVKSYSHNTERILMLCQLSRTVEAHSSTELRRLADLLNTPGANIEDNFLQFEDLGKSGSIPSSGYGAWTRHETHNSQFIADGNTPGQLKSIARGQVNREINSLMNRLDAAMNLAEITIMMPGGEVMTYSGMDTTNDAQLYAHVKYALGAYNVQQT
jgi:hypothetical protein